MSTTYIQPYQVTGTLANGQTYVDNFTIQYNYDSSASSRPSSSVVSNVNLSVNGTGNLFSSSDYLGGSYATVNGNVSVNPNNTVIWTNATNDPAAFSTFQIFGANGTNLQSISATSGNAYLPSGNYEMVKFNLRDANAWTGNGSVAPDAAGGVGNLLSINANTQNGVMPNVASTSYDFFKNLTVQDASGTAAKGSLGFFDKGKMSVTASDPISIVCYAKGTLITTERGQVAVEKLKVGDQVLTVSGQYEPVKWLGHRRINCKRQANPAQAWPVRVAKDAFGLDLPTRDLILSPGHAVLVDGNLVPIIHLTNGITITQEPWSKVTYYHVELPSHNAIYAEGLPAETYLDDNNRKFFLEANSQDAVVDLDAPFSEERSQANWAQYGFAPMVNGGPALEAIRTKLLTRLVQSGYELTASQEELSLLADGQAIPFLRTPAGVLAWIPAGVSELSIQSNHFVPGHIYANSFDGRRLGVSVSEVRLGNKAIALDDAALLTGWHAIESQYEMAEQTQGKAAYNWRWTDGNATLKLERNACALEITLEGTAKANWQAKTQEDSQHHNVLKAAA